MPTATATDPLHANFLTINNRLVQKDTKPKKKSKTQKNKAGLLIADPPLTSLATLSKKEEEKRKKERNMSCDTQHMTLNT